MKYTFETREEMAEWLELGGEFQVDDIVEVKSPDSDCLDWVEYMVVEDKSDDMYSRG